MGEVRGLRKECRELSGGRSQEMPGILTRKGIWKSWNIQGDNVERLLCGRRSLSFCGGTTERATKDALRGLLSEQPDCC